ncbi:DUF1616 domain-containing protein [Chloroflexota bacterium]
MRFKIGSGLLPLTLLMIVLAVVIFIFPSHILRVILGLPFVLFFPGYALITALFPRRGAVGGLERVVLSFGLSLAVVPLIMLILNNSPWEIKLESIFYSTASFTFIISLIAWFNWKKLASEERFTVEFQVERLRLTRGTMRQTPSIILVIAIVAAIAALGYVIAMPTIEEGYTEFYIMGQEDRATSYPKQLEVGEEGSVMVNVANWEFETISYRAEVRIDGLKNSEIGSIVLKHGEKWAGQVAFVSRMVGEKQKVELLLYKNSETEAAFKTLHLWIDVK